MQKNRYDSVMIDNVLKGGQALPITGENILFYGFIVLVKIFLNSLVKLSKNKLMKLK